MRVQGLLSADYATQSWGNGNLYKGEMILVNMPIFLDVAVITYMVNLKFEFGN